MADENQSPINYLIKWSGAVFIVLIVSIAGHCAVENMLVPKREDTCPAQVAKVIVDCMDNLNPDELSCMVNGVNLLKACPRDEQEAQ